MKTEVIKGTTISGMVYVTPLYGNGFDKFKKLKDGKNYICEIKAERNLGFHRKFFALLRMAIENMPERVDIKTTSQLLVHLKLRLGYYEKLVLHEGGKELFIPKSISFSSMDDLEFEKFFNSVFDELDRHYLKLGNREDIDVELAGFM